MLEQVAEVRSRVDHDVGVERPGFHIGNNVTGFDTKPPDYWYDAWFIDANHGDFHPAPGSPLIGAGDDTLGGVLGDAELATARFDARAR